MKLDRAVIEVNGGCNYSCAMCPQSRPEGRGKNWLKKMSIDEFERIVAQLAEDGLNVVNLEGSGEPTLNRNLPKYIEIVRKYGAKPVCFSNGYRFNDVMMRECIDAGLWFYRFSCIGYDQETYKKWMNTDAFHRVRENARAAVEYAKGKDCEIGSYHLLLDPGNAEYEVEQYRKNFIDYAGTNAEIWKMHNWSGVYDIEHKRDGKVKTCGRPFSPDLVIRAGGLDGKTGAVHPCCQVLGNDDAAVLGHMSENTADEIFNGELYRQLREDHTTGNYPDYCKSCDFLIDDPEVLVWTNSDRSINHMKGTEFSLADFRSE